MVVAVSWCHVFEETLRAEIITSDLQLFDFCCLLLLALGQAVLSFLPASGLGEGRGASGVGVGGVTWPRCSAALTRGLLKSLSQLAAINTAVCTPCNATPCKHLGGDTFTVCLRLLLLSPTHSGGLFYEKS